MDQNLESLSKRELLAIAKEKGLKGVGAWTKEQLASKLALLLKPLTRKKDPDPVPTGDSLGGAPPAAEQPTVKVVPKARPATGKGGKGSKAERPKKPGKLEGPAATAHAGAAVKAVDPAPTEPVSPGDAASSAPVATGAKVATPETPAGGATVLTSADDLLEATEFGTAETAEPAGKARPTFKRTTRIDELLAVDEELGDLPPGYDEDRAVLLVRDPYWVFAYWDLSRASLKTAEARGDYRQILRVQELGGFGQNEPTSFYDVPVPKTARSWYLRLPGDGRRYRVEVAFQHRDGGYTPVARTNPVDVPRGEPSEVVADRFVTLPGGEDQIQARPSSTLPPVAEWDIAIAPLTAEPPSPVEPAFPSAPLGTPRPAFGPRLSGPWSAEMPWALRPEAQTPGGIQPAGVGSQSVGSWSFGASEKRFGDKKKDFWLVADAELIVYGATEPDARVTLRGERVDLRPDGTFTFRFYLPDGEHPIPIRAVNADGDDERAITISVSRVTTGDPRVNLLTRAR